ncbi:periplasmic flagellar collar protein FlcA [Entomospira culicis]
MAGNDDLNKLKQTLENLSDEPLWREKRGESIEDVLMEQSPTIEREAIVREADLNREENINAEPQEESQMSDEDKKEEPSLEPTEAFADFDGADLSNLEDPGLETLRDENASDELDFSSFDDMNLSLDEFPSEDNPVEDEATNKGELFPDAPLPNEQEEEALEDTISVEELASLAPSTPENSADDASGELESTYNMTNESSLDTGIDDLALPDMDDALDLMDMDKPIEIFGDSDDDQAILAMGEGDELADMLDEEPVLYGSEGVDAADLLAESDLDHQAKEDSVDHMESDFNLGDFGDINVDAKESPAKSDVSDAEEEDAYEEDEESVDPESLLFSQQKIDQINASLARLPRNLRLAMHKILASEETEPAVVQRLTKKLLKRASARSLVNDVRELTGQTIILPNRYQQNAGEEFEKRRGGFAYNFKHLAWPWVKPVMVVTVLVALVVFIGFSAIYRPLTAGWYYRNGLVMLEAGDYDEAMLNFRVAHDGWRAGPMQVQGVPRQRWFFEYAEAFTRQRQYTLAQEMYDRLLRAYPTSQRAYLTYGDFESRHRSNFERADQIYVRYLNDVNSKDVQMLSARSENLLRWGAYDESRLKQARDVYAILIQTDGLSDRTVMGLLEFSVLRNDRTEIERWAGYIQANPKMKLDPATLALAASWFLDQGRAGEAEKLLQKAIELEEKDPILHYQLARFYEEVGDLSSASNSLSQAIFLIANRQPMTLRDTEVYIDVFRRSANFRFKENIMDERAQSELERAIAYYENGVERRILGRNPFHGRMYLELGDIFYIRDRALQLADIHYEKALENSFDDADLRYKRGYIAYNRGDLTNAINNFSLAYGMESGHANTIYSLATALAVDGRSASAQAYYQELREILESERLALASSDASAMEVLRRENGEYLMKVYNNLGVVLADLAQRSPNRVAIEQQAQIAFQQAMFLWDALSRDPESRARVISQELPGMNFRALLHPVAGQESTYLYDSLAMFLENPPVSWGF